MATDTATKSQTPYEKWQATIDDALTNRDWDKYDSSIKTIIAEFDLHLRLTPGYVSPDWKIIKAMVWTESGGPTKPAWKTRPIQIGNPGDPGLAALFSGKEGGDLVISPTQKRELTVLKAAADPVMNIRAGVAYLLMRSIQVPRPTKTFMSSDTTIYTVTVKGGDSFDRIAHACKTTIEVLKKMNPKAGVLQPKQVLTYQKASVGEYIGGWLPMTLAHIARRYNTGDAEYAKKLQYCLTVMAKVVGGK